MPTTPTNPIKINGVRLHESITEDRVLERVEAQMSSLDNPGICILCGIDIEGVEPDAEKYPCESCGAPHTVYGAQQLVLYLVA